MAKSISYRINSLVVGTLSLLVIAFLLVLYILVNSLIKFSNETLEKQARKEVSELAKNVYNLVDNSNELSKKMLAVSLNLHKEIVRRVEVFLYKAHNVGLLLTNLQMNQLKLRYQTLLLEEQAYLKLPVSI